MLKGNGDKPHLDHSSPNLDGSNRRRRRRRRRHHHHHHP